MNIRCLYYGIEFKITNFYTQVNFITEQTPLAYFICSYIICYLFALFQGFYTTVLQRKKVWEQYTLSFTSMGTIIIIINFISSKDILWEKYLQYYSFKNKKELT